MSVKDYHQNVGHQKCQKKVVFCQWQLQRCQNEYKKQIAILQQKTQFLKEDLKQYQQRDQDNKKINESIMMTYQQSQSIREEHTVKTIKQLTVKYQSQMKKIKENNFHQCKRLEEELACMRDKYDEAVLLLDKRNLEHQKAIIEVRKKHEENLEEILREKEEQMKRKLQTAEEKVKQAEAMAEVYKQFVQKRRELLEDEDDSDMRVMDFSIRGSVKKQYERNKENMGIRDRKSLIKNIEESNRNGQMRLSASKESIKMINKKINRAITQLKAPNTYYEKINERLKGKGIF